MSAQQQAAWPEGVIARYLTVGGALVDVSHETLYVDDAKPNTTLARCGGAGCGSYNDEEWGRWADRFDNGSGAADSVVREWAQAHAETCRALPKPGVTR